VVSSGDGEGVKDDEPLDLDPSSLLADAAAMPGGDDLAATIERLQNTPQPRGAVGGPIRHYVRMEARQTRTFNVEFRANEYARIDVRGDGDTDLDCWVYDENWNLIDSDLDYTDWCILEFNPRWAGVFNLRVRNLGSIWNGTVITSN
jgi:hypothetical protein